MLLKKLFYRLQMLYKIFIFEKMKISRKRFVKLLMSIGYQRNEANKIAWHYHAEKGRYTFLDFIKESNK